MIKEYFLKNEKESRELAIEIASLLKPGDVVFLKGDLGAGKTTMVKAIAEYFDTDAKSPTFALVNIYEGKEIISHIDLYRLNSYSEALSIGIEDILSDSTIKIIEWPEILGDEYYDLMVEIFYQGEGRRAELSGPFLNR